MPGAPVPSERELAARYGVAVMTAARALRELRDLGLVVTQQGRRTIVRPVPHVRLLHTGFNHRARRATGLANWNAEVLAQGQQPEQRLLAVERVPAPHDVARLLQLAEAGTVLVRRRLYFVNGVPVQLGDSYYTLGLAAGTRLELPLKITGGAHALIEDELGRRMVRMVEELTARMPSGGEAEALQLGAREPVIRVLRTAYDAAGEPLEVADSIMVASLHEFRYEIDVDRPEPPPAIYVGRPAPSE